MSSTPGTTTYVSGRDVQGRQRNVPDRAIVPLVCGGSAGFLCGLIASVLDLVDSLRLRQRIRRPISAFLSKMELRPVNSTGIFRSPLL